MQYKNRNHNVNFWRIADLYRTKITTITIWNLQPIDHKLKILKVKVRSAFYGGVHIHELSRIVKSTYERIKNKKLSLMRKSNCT